MHAWLDAPVRGALVEGLGDELSEFAPGLAIYEALSERDGQVLMTSLSTTLVAISAGAVFMGANTYIGNAPNFMVKLDRAVARRADAELLRLHALVGSHSVAAVRAADARLLLGRVQTDAQSTTISSTAIAVTSRRCCASNAR